MFFDSHLDKLKLIEIDELGLDLASISSTGLINKQFACYIPKNKRQVIHRPDLLQVSKMFVSLVCFIPCRTWDLCSSKPETHPK